MRSIIQRRLFCMHSLQYLDISQYQNYILFSFMWPVSKWKSFLLERTILLNIFVYEPLYFFFVNVVSFILAELSRGIFRSSKIFGNDVYQELFRPSITFEKSSASWSNELSSRFSRRYQYLYMALTMSR